MIYVNTSVRMAVEKHFTVHEYDSPGRQVVFVFGGWRFKAVAYRSLVRDLTRRGFHCVLYAPSPRLVSVGTQYTEIVEAAQLAVQDAHERIKVAETGTSFVSFGISLGTIFATEVAKASPVIKQVVLITPFGDFAEHVKLWPQHPYFGQVLRSQHTDQATSGEVLNRAGLAKNLNKLRGKRLLCCYATRDRVVHTAVTLRFFSLLEQSNIPIKIVKVSGGHMLGIFKFLFVYKPYLAFLKHG